MNNQIWKHGVESLKNECKITIREKKKIISVMLGIQNLNLNLSFNIRCHLSIE